MIMKLPQVEARRRNQGLRRRHEARSWSDVDVWRSLFHSPLAMDKEEEVTGPARSLCAAVTSTGRSTAPRAAVSVQSRVPSRPHNWISLVVEIRVFLRTAKSGFLRRVIVHSTLLFLRPLSRWSAGLSLMPSILSELQGCVHASSSE